MVLFDKEKNEELEAFILPLTESDFEMIQVNDGFGFDWVLERENSIFKIILQQEADSILGLMSLVDLPQELRIHINLIEVNRENIGRIKKLDKIAGCLIAYACSMAFKKGYGGFVSLQPKTKLIALYKNKYGFSQFGRMLAVQFEASANLVTKYLGDEEI